MSILWPSGHSLIEACCSKIISTCEPSFCGHQATASLKLFLHLLLASSYPPFCGHQATASLKRTWRPPWTPWVSTFCGHQATASLKHLGAVDRVLDLIPFCGHQATASLKLDPLLPLQPGKAAFCGHQATASLKHDTLIAVIRLVSSILWPSGHSLIEACPGYPRACLRASHSVAIRPQPH